MDEGLLKSDSLTGVRRMKQKHPHRKVCVRNMNKTRIFRMMKLSGARSFRHDMHQHTKKGYELPFGVSGKIPQEFVVMKREVANCVWEKKSTNFISANTTPACQAISLINISIILAYYTLCLWFCLDYCYNGIT